MDAAMRVAESGLKAHHRNIEVISNNLANANTTSFKKNRAGFEDLAYQVLRQPGSPTSDVTNSPTGMLVGTGVRVADNKKLFTDGPIIQTGNAWDVAIAGRGFLRIQIPNQPNPAFTRAGNLQVNELGQFVLPNGYLLDPPLIIPEGTLSVQISRDGVVNVKTNAGLQEIGRLELTDFMNPAGLEAIGENLYRETIASGQPITGIPGNDGLGTIEQFSLESSNVNVVEEMVNLIEAQRSFEVTSKAISAIDSMLQNLSREI
ncbi:flagellar basal body rod protein FlgG [Legionella geestiana]|uniref:Flagellar basal-body rod protein FlgG n=2 Tax=Legionella geestiana TaxID=45065 RepID=A0A0W0U1R0_9GAMM|nr:flagellar basal body rod protein FlgG [Legionella geestiana]QBS13389.1 flagellar basal-body rod protein FlgG [Legionella geestiana]QDQ41132.1 flagellar basal-body rod protein FlgG [Legionella geestiana]STX53436.1 flagellar basal-body rod protein FlgG [Legionella geestiana]